MRFDDIIERSAMAMTTDPMREAVDFAAVRRLRSLIVGTWATSACCAATELRVADHLQSEPLAIEDLSGSIGVNPDALHRVLRALVSWGVFSQLPDGRFANNAVSNLLRSDATGSLGGLARMYGGRLHAATWGRLTDCIRTGTPGFELEFGTPLFEYLSRQPDEAAIFDAAMLSSSGSTARAVLDACDFSSYATVADVAGGYGGLLFPILEAHPHLRGTLFDMPHVIAKARSQCDFPKLRERVTFVAGDIFESLPKRCDAYLLKNILHDWDDQSCLRILGNFASAMSDSSRLLVIERLIQPGNDEDFAKLLDLEMLVLTHGGRERTQREFLHLFQSTGLILQEETRTAVGLVVMELSKR